MGIRITLAARYLGGRKLRAFLTTLAVVFGVLVIFGMNILIPTMMQAIQSGMIAASGEVDMTVTLKSGDAFPASSLERLAGVSGLRAVQGLLARTVNLPPHFYNQDPKTPDTVGVLSLIGIDPLAARSIRPYPVKEGRFLEPADANAVVITESLAASLGLKLGGSLPLPTAQGLVRLSIVGLSAPRAVPGNEEVLVTLTEAQALLAQPGQITAIEGSFETADAARRAEIRLAVEKGLGPSFTLETLPTSGNLYAALQAGQIGLSAFGALALFMGAFIIFNTFRTIVAERRRDVGMLRAIGASRRLVVGTILVEGFIQGVLGTAVGMVLGYLLAAAGTAALNPMTSALVHIKFGLPVITPGITIASAVIGVGVTLAAGLFPALSAGKVTPMEALRPSPDVGAYRKAIGASAIVGIVFIGLSLAALASGNTAFLALGTVLFMVGLVLVAPVLVRPLALAFGALAAAIFAREGTGTLAQNNLKRQPSRSAVTASTTMIALAIIIAMGSMTVSISRGFLGVMRQTLGSDYIFVPPALAMWQNDVGANAGLAETLRAIDGVERVSTLRYAGALMDVKAGAAGRGAVAGGGAVALLGVDPVAYPKVASLSFSAGNQDKAFAELARGRGVIVNPALAAQTGLKVGDVLPLQTPDGRVEYRVSGIATDFMNAKIAAAFISQADLAGDFHKTDDIMIQVNLKHGADATAADAAIRAAARDYPQFSITEGKALFEQMSTMFTQIFGALYLLLVFLALPSLLTTLNTLAIGVIERTREIGMLRAVGTTQRQVRRTVLAEALLLASFGTAFGLVAGLYLGYLVVKAMASAGFPTVYVFPWAGVAIAVVIGMAFGALAAIIPARKAARMEIVQALRYE